MSDNILNITLLQTNPVWENAEANISDFDKWIENIPLQTKVLVLPEMFLTGFSMNIEKVIQKMDGEGVNWMVSNAKSKNITIIGSLAITENNCNYNRLLAVFPNGKIQCYDKRHLFRMGEENNYYSSGNENIILDIDGWKVMPLICYDLRFPVWSRNLGLKYDVLLYIANWPNGRRDAFITLLKARAIENQCYVVAVNRVGTDANGIKYSGDSVIIDPKGSFLTETGNNEQVIAGAISLNELQKYRNKFPTYLDADNFEIKK